MASPRTRKGKGTEQTNALLEALNTIAKAQDKAGHVGDKHCRIKSGWVIGSTGRLSIGIKCETPFEANPNTEELMLALSKTRDQVSFALQPNMKLHIKSGHFSVYVGTVADEFMPTVVPDAPVAKITDKLLEALTVCADVVDDSLDNPIFKGVLLDGYSCAATDRSSIIQFWHGIHLPRGAIIPKATIKALGSRDGKLTEFGFSRSTVTFYYEDGGFVQSLLYEGQFPNYCAVLDMPANWQKVPNEFFNGLSTILDFASDGTIYFGEARLSTVSPDDIKHAGASYDVPGISKGGIFNGNRFKLLEKHAVEVDLYHQRGAMFRGNGCRGIIARRR